MVPKMPKPRQIPVPDRSDEEIQANAAEVRKQLLAGRGTSFLTGGLGVPTSSQSYAATQLLGGGAKG